MAAGEELCRKRSEPPPAVLSQWSQACHLSKQQGHRRRTQLFCKLEGFGIAFQADGFNETLLEVRPLQAVNFDNPAIVGRMHKLVIADVDADMAERALGIEENQIALS